MHSLLEKIHLLREELQSAGALGTGADLAFPDYCIESSIANPTTFFATILQSVFRYDEKSKRDILTLFASGFFSSAVLEVLKLLEDDIRRLSGIEDKYGVDLVNQVFCVRDPKICLNAGKNRSEKSERDGFKDIFAGFIKAFRNPTAHERNWINDANDAFAIIVFVDFLRRRMKRAGPATI